MTGTSVGETSPDPARTQISLPSREKPDNCRECGGDIDRRERPRAKFCSEKCRYRHRDRERYAQDPERERSKSRAYYGLNRKRVLERVKAQQGRGAGWQRLCSCGKPTHSPRSPYCSTCRMERSG